MQVDVHDASPGAQRDEHAQLVQPLGQRRLGSQQGAHLAHRAVARGLVAQRLVLLGAGDDLGVQVRELLGELEVRVGEGVGARRVVEVQDAQHAALVDQRHAERRFDVEALAHDAEGLTVRLAAQAQRARVGGHAAGDAFADPHADLRPQLGLDAGRDAHAQLARLGVEQHQRAALGAGHAERDLEHAPEQLVGVDGQVVGLDHLVQRLQQLGLAVALAAAVAPEQARDQRRHDLHAALGDVGEARGEARVGAGVDHGVQARCRAASAARSEVRCASSERARPRSRRRSRSRVASGFGSKTAPSSTSGFDSSPGSSWSASSDAK